MSARIKYTDEPIGEPRVIKNFLPPPHQLILREEEVKITITLSKRSVDFFKLEAAKADAQYQRMIRRLLDAYVDAHFVLPDRRPAKRRSKATRAA